MAFNNRRSWRLKFIDIDSSFTMVAADSPINGFIVCRAPKGTQRPTYFSKGNSQAIDALMGVGSADWPDLLEAKAYNNEYPLYISAPPGTSDAYPSRLGGFYLTKNGIYKFYNVTDKQELADASGNAFKVKVQPGKEEQFNADFAKKKTKIVISAPEFEDREPAEDEPGYGIFSFKKAEEANQSFISFEKNVGLNVTQIDYYEMLNGLVSPVGNELTYWGDNEGRWNFAGQIAKLSNFGFEYGPEESDINPLRDWIGEDNYNALSGEPIKLANLLINGSVEHDGTTYSIAFGIQDLFYFLVDIKEDTYVYFMQKGPTEIETAITLSKIGYDKYRYDEMFTYAPFDKDKFEDEGKLVLKTTGSLGAKQDEINEIMANNEYMVFYDPDAPETIAHIGRYETDELSGEPYYSECTETFITKYITCQDALDGTVNKDLYHKIFYVESEDSCKHLYTEEECISMFGTEDGPKTYVNYLANGNAAPKNLDFNTITISCSEEVNPGETVSGGEFHGSLEERGKDSFGNGIYFPEILTDDDMSFIEVRVLKPFGDDVSDLDGTGFWTHSRIIDPFDADGDKNRPTTKSFTISGDRYCTLVMQMNKIEGKTGGIYRDEYYGIIKDGLAEAMLPEYDDVMVFMEPTGQEVFKSQLHDISIYQELAAVISPKILTPNNKNMLTDAIAQKVIVNGRVSMRSNAQYAGEFESYDPVTLKKYWCQPIGDVGCNIARIFDKKYGGWSPAWTNISGDLGGQLKRSFLRSRYQFEDEATKTLDAKGINPIVYTQDEGAMIVSQKTTQDPNNLSDWSYLGHSLSFQLVKREIRDNVMRPQVMKPINGYWMNLRQGQVDNILAKRTGGSSPIWAAASCDISGQNTDQTKAQRNFVIKVKVKVNVFSETVTLILENVAQDASI
jgi:hypothetical protein